MNTLLSLACLLVAVTAHVTYVYLRRRSSFLRKLQGPESTSFFLGEYLDLFPSVFTRLCRISGNEGDIRYQNEVGDREFDWMRKYGSAWRRRGPLGVSFFKDRMKPSLFYTGLCSKVDHLSLADPKALQYVLHTSGYHFPKGREVTQNIKLIVGQGIVWAHGPWILALPASIIAHSL